MKSFGTLTAKELFMKYRHGDVLILEPVELPKGTSRPICRGRMSYHTGNREGRVM